MSNVDKTKLNALVANLDAGKFADPELLQVVIEEVYSNLDIRPGNAEVLLKTNTTAFTPSADYHPSTKKYVDSEIVDKTISKGNATPFTPTSDYQPSTKKYVDDEISNNTLTLTNTTPYTPSTDYHPTTMRYVVDAINAAIVNIGGTAIIQTGTAFPSSPTAGQSFFHTDENRFYVYSGSAWEDSARQALLDVHMADNRMHVQYAAATGSANTYAVTLSPAPTSYVEGMAVSVKINIQNAGASTINVNGLGAKSILKANGSAVASANLRVNSVYTLRYNGTAFILQGEGGEYGTATATQVLAPYTIGTENGLVPGSMQNLGAADIQSSFSADVAIPAGYRNGSGKVKSPVPGAGDSTITEFRDDASYSYTIMTKVRTATINVGGTYRVTFSLYQEVTGNAYGRIYKNGVPVGLIRSNNTTNDVYFTEDFSVVAGDKLELWVQTANTSGRVIARFFRFSINTPAYVTIT